MEKNTRIALDWTVPDQYTGKPVIAAFITALLEEIQEVENTDSAILDSLLLSRASGRFLTDWENLVQPPRSSALSDDERRVMILAQGFANRSTSHPRDLQDLLNALGLNFMGDWFAHGAVVLRGPAPSFPPQELIGAVLRGAVAAGCGLMWIDIRGVFLRDPGFHELFAYSWGLGAGSGTVSKGGTLRLDGLPGLFAEGSAYGEAGVMYRVTGQYRGTAPLLVVDTAGVVADFPISEGWADFDCMWTLGATTRDPLPSSTSPLWVEIRGVTLTAQDPLGYEPRTDRTLRTVHLAGTPRLSKNGWGSLTSPPPAEMAGGYLSHVERLK